MLFLYQTILKSLDNKTDDPFIFRTYYVPLTRVCLFSH